jgi:integration host factor subunit alpha
MTDEGSGRDSRTITKADLVEAVHTKVGFSKKESGEIVERVFESMKRTLESGDDLKISGFGKFDVRRKNARRGRNPKTEEGLIIPARTVVTFKASQILKTRVAGDNARSTFTVDGGGDDDVDDEHDDELDGGDAEDTLDDDGDDGDDGDDEGGSGR